MYPDLLRILNPVVSQPENAQSVVPPAQARLALAQPEPVDAMDVPYPYAHAAPRNIETWRMQTAQALARPDFLPNMRHHVGYHAPAQTVAVWLNGDRDRHDNLMDLSHRLMELPSDAVQEISLRDPGNACFAVNQVARMLPSFLSLSRLDIPIDAFRILEAVPYLQNLAYLTLRFDSEAGDRRAWGPAYQPGLRNQLQKVMAPLTRPVMKLHVGHLKPWHHDLLDGLLLLDGIRIDTIVQRHAVCAPTWQQQLYGLAPLPSLRQLNTFLVGHEGQAQNFVGAPDYAHFLTGLGQARGLRNVEWLHADLAFHQFPFLINALATNPTLRNLTVAMAPSPYFMDRVQAATMSAVADLAGALGGRTRVLRIIVRDDTTLFRPEWMEGLAYATQRINAFLREQGCGVLYVEAALAPRALDADQP